MKMEETVNNKNQGTSANDNTNSDFENCKEAFWALFHNNPQPMFIFDKDTLEFMEVNNAALQKYGYTEDEFTTITMKDIRPEEDIPLMYRILHKEGKTFHQHEPIRHKTKNGDIFYVEYSSQDLSYKNKNARYIQINDVTQKLEAEQKLRESVELLNLSVASSGDGIWDLDLLSEKIKITPSVKTMLGYDESDNLDELPQLLRIVHPQDMNEMARKLMQHKDSDESIITCEIRLLCKKGTYKWIMLRARVVKVDESGNPIRLIGVNTDIDKRKKFELSVLENIRKEKEMAALRARLLAVTSTDFKSPLMSMILKLDVLSNYMDKMTQEDMQENFRQLSSNAALLSKLNDNMINLIKLESGSDNYSSIIP